jgi:WD40 repeat protein
MPCNLQGHSGGIWSIAFSPDGHLLASSSEDHTVKLWDTSSDQCLKTLRGHSNRVTSVAFSTQGTTLASGSDDQTVKLWDTSSGQCLKTMELIIVGVNQLLSARIVKLWQVAVITKR